MWSQLVQGHCIGLLTLHWSTNQPVYAESRILIASETQLAAMSHQQDRAFLADQLWQKLSGLFKL